MSRYLHFLNNWFFRFRKFPASPTCYGCRTESSSSSSQDKNQAKSTATDQFQSSSRPKTPCKANHESGSLESRRVQRNNNQATTSFGCNKHTNEQNPPTLMSSQQEKNILVKKRVIKMMIILVVEFFICWTPIFAMQAAHLFGPRVVHELINTQVIPFFYLMSYLSSCINPITYCFINRSYMQALMKLFKCKKNKKNRQRRPLFELNRALHDSSFRLPHRMESAV